MDPSVIVGYLVAKLLGGAGRFADKKVEQLLDALAERVWSRVGGGGALDRLARDPGDEVAQDWAKDTIGRTAADDPAFGRDLDRLAGELRRAAPDLVVHAPGAETVVGVNSGYLIKGPVTIHHHGPRHPDPLEQAGPVVRVVIAIGVLLCVGGLGLFGYTLFTDMPELGDPDFMEVPSGIPRAAAVFFTGFVLIAVASVVGGLGGRRTPGART